MTNLYPPVDIATIAHSGWFLKPFGHCYLLIQRIIPQAKPPSIPTPGTLDLFDPANYNQKPQSRGRGCMASVTGYQSIQIDRLTPHIGAQMSGAALDNDLSNDLSNEQFSEIYKAWLDWNVLSFRDQHLNGEQHKAFARGFSTLHVHPMQHSYGGDPEILRIKTTIHHRQRLAYRRDLRRDPAHGLSPAHYRNTKTRWRRYPVCQHVSCLRLTQRCHERPTGEFNRSSRWCPAVLG